MRPVFHPRVSKYAPGRGSVSLACPFSFIPTAAYIFRREYVYVALHPFFHACLSYASTVLPVCDSETVEGTAMCAYPAGIDLATGEGVFVSPHGCRYVVDIRSMSSSRGRSASEVEFGRRVRFRVLGLAGAFGLNVHRPAPREHPTRPRSLASKSVLSPVPLRAQYGI